MDPAPRIDITKERFSTAVEAVWPIERLNDIIAQNGAVKLLFGGVKSWEDLVNAIDWDWVVKTVEGLKDELVRESVVGAELAERALSSLKLYAEFMEKRKEGWAKVIEVLSGGQDSG